MMERALKERIIGAAVLVLFVVLVVPIFLDGPPDDTEMVSERVLLPGQEEQKTQTVVLDRDRTEPVPGTPVETTPQPRPDTPPADEEPAPKATQPEAEEPAAEPVVKDEPVEEEPVEEEPVIPTWEVVIFSGDVKRVEVVDDVLAAEEAPASDASPEDADPATFKGWLKSLL